MLKACLLGQLKPITVTVLTRFLSRECDIMQNFTLMEGNENIFSMLYEKVIHNCLGFFIPLEVTLKSTFSKLFLQTQKVEGKSKFCKGQYLCWVVNSSGLSSETRELGGLVMAKEQLIVQAGSLGLCM